MPTAIHSNGFVGSACTIHGKATACLRPGRDDPANPANSAIHEKLNVKRMHISLVNSDGSNGSLTRLTDPDRTSELLIQ